MNIFEGITIILFVFLAGYALGCAVTWAEWKKLFNPKDKGGEW